MANVGHFIYFFCHKLKAFLFQMSYADIIV